MATINLNYNQLVIVGMPEEKEVSITTSSGNVTYPPTDGTAKLPPYYCNHNTSDDTDDDSQTDTEKVENIKPVLARIKAFDNKSVYTVSTQIQSANLVTCINPVKEKLTDVDINDLYVLNLEDREVTYKYSDGSSIKLHINDKVYVFPYTEKYLILSFNANNTKALVIKYSDSINANRLNTNDMLIINLTCNKAIPPSDENGGIPYTYTEEVTEP